MTPPTLGLNWQLVSLGQEDQRETEVGFCHPRTEKKELDA